MNWMTIVGITYFILSAVHLIKRPEFSDVSENGITIWFMQLWFYQFMTIFLFVADTFYSKMK